MTFLKKFRTHEDYQSFYAGSEFKTPNVSFCDFEDEMHYEPYHDYSADYMATVARESGTISFNIWRNMGTDYITSISYSTDEGATWTTTNNTNGKQQNFVISVDVNQGDKVLWKGVAQQLGFYDENEDIDDMVGSFFSSDCEFDAEGNVMSMLYGDAFSGETTLEYDYQFSWLFSDYDRDSETLIVNARNLLLPATTLANSCYEYMFYYCTSLTTAPALPATTLADNCYEEMFYGCTSLTTAPALPATTLADNCYSEMFRGCISLTTAPALPATTLANGCYYSMFRGCTNLNSITCLATNISASNCTTNWVQGVSASGTFTKDASMTGWATGVNGIPTNWTVEDYS